MQVSVTFRHMESSDALRKYAEEKTERLSKYLFEPIEVHWVLSIEKIRHIADATVAANGVAIKAQEDTQDMYSAIDSVIDKLENQVRRHKERIKQHKSHSGESSGMRYAVAGAEDSAGRRLKIVKKENRFIKPMSVEEAAMQMEIAGNDFLVFTDSSTSAINVIYRLENGDLGLIETNTRL